MPLHPDAPVTVTGDFEAYAERRLDNVDEEERRALAGMSEADKLAFFLDELWDAMDSPHEIAVENAEIELEMEREQGKRPH
jgi:hypothetical protein